MAATGELVATEIVTLTTDYLAAQLAGNRRAALSLIDSALGRGVSALEIQLDVITAAQRRIGELWQQDRISVAQEHMATAISQLALAHIYQNAVPRAANGRKIIIACVSGEQHDFPARLVADCLDLAGYDTRFLGANVPTSSLVETVQREQPHLVALSVTMTFNIPAARLAVADLRRAIQNPLPIVMGGNACRDRPELAMEIGADATARDAREIVDGIDRLLGVRG